MRIDRTKNTTNNLKWGVVEKIVALVIPFICRTAIIQLFGVNYLGLNSLFTSILSTLSLTELGFGSAIVYFMYRAVAEDDKSKICALLSYIKRVYRCVGLIILMIGLCLIPFLKYLIKADIPVGINIHTLYLLTLASTVQSYFMFAYKSAIFRAHQRVDVLSRISSVVMAIEKLLQLIFIFVFRNYYLYIASVILGGVFNNLLVHFEAKRRYPCYYAIGDLNVAEKKEIYSKIRGLLLYKVGDVVNGSADSVIISAFLGLTIMGKYGNYYYIVSFLMSFLGIYYSSWRAGVGNSIVVESVEQNFKVFKTLQFAQNWIVGWCTVCLICLFQDFIALYAGRQNQLHFGYVLSLCLYFWIWKIQDVVHVFKEASGMWAQDRYRPLLGASINLMLNIALVQVIGLYGVILSTAFVFTFIDLPWASSVLFKQYFGFSAYGYYKLLWRGFVQTLCMIVPTCFLCGHLRVESLVVQLFLKALVCLIVPNLLYMGMNYKREEYVSLISKVKYVLKIQNK